MFPELFCSHKIKHKKLRKYFFSFYLQTSHQSTNSRRFALRANPALSSRLSTHSPLPHTTISRRSALRTDPDHSSRPQHTPTSPHNNLTPICPPGRSSPSSRPSTPGSGSGVVAPAAQTGALASSARRCHGAGVRSVPHTQIEQPTPHRLLHKSSFDGS